MPRTCSSSTTPLSPTRWRGTSTRCGAVTLPSPCRLLPLDRRRWLRRDVEDDPVHCRDLVDDSARDRLEQVVGQAGPVRRHRVLARHRTDDDRIPVRALVALNAHGPDRRQDAEALPELAVEPGPPNLLQQDRVRLAQRLQPLAGDLADDPDGEAGPRERVPPDHRLWQAKLLAHPPHL